MKKSTLFFVLVLIASPLSFVHAQIADTRFGLLSLENEKLFIGLNGGESGIRTRGTLWHVRRFSKPLLSTTQPSLRSKSGSFRFFGLRSILKVRFFAGELGGNSLSYPTIFDIEIFATTIVRLLTQILSSFDLF